MRRLTTGLVLMLAATATAACGETGGDNAAASQSASDKQERARVQLEACLRKQGVDIGERPAQGGPSQVEASKLREAMEGPCRKYREQAFGNFSEEDRAEMRDRMVKFASCMRKHGVDMPDPGDPGEQPTAVRIDRDDPKVRRATDACRDLMPNGGRGGPVFVGPGGPPPGE